MRIHCRHCQSVLTKTDALALIPAPELAKYFPPPHNRSAIPIEAVADILNAEESLCPRCRTKGEWACDAPGESRQDRPNIVDGK